MFSVFVHRFWLSCATIILLKLTLFPAKVQGASLIPSSSNVIDVSSPQLKQKINHITLHRQINNVLLSEQLENLDISAVQGNVGIGVLDLNSGKSWFLNGKQRFPMQSVYKLPIAIAVLKLVDEGKISLNQLVTITRQEFAPGWSPIIKDIKGDKAQFTVKNLLERSVGISDNTAADALVRLIGGTKQVNLILNRLKIQDVRIDRLEQQMQPDSVGLTNFSPELVDEQKFAQAIEQIPEQQKKAALEKYLADPRDTATPKGMIDLLKKLHSNELLKQNSTELLLKMMTDSPTGRNRLKAGLTKNWSIAHKTGTGLDVLQTGTATNDVGIISSSNGKRIAIAVFIAGSKAPLEVREKLMANIASAVVKAMQ
ncbi:MAG: class A beta-lactamase [Mojavia pulchra JT2-VF2]|jgi:beta-lactamase class A|uniref:Class A beta-lactamase n=1 Tax=Mojavia pulchra JT2-VF2 TaxID=287848 RepID=A0A951UGZ7_9NOST|nr:class A beta-lactamase [Mojavia pulchra JT2-VF2]